jgi:hypothetical protein
MIFFLFPEHYSGLLYIFKIIQILIPQVDSTDIHSRIYRKILNITICEKGTEINVK